MTAISIMIEGQQGLNWSRWKRLVAEVEALGFAGLFRSDHFTDPQPPDQDSLELLVSLAYLADHTERVHFGPLVAPVSFRDPIMFARQAAALDDLSNGRMIFGLGAGWQDREHHMFGYELGDIPTRFARLEEALEATTRLLQGDQPATYEGQFYQLHEAMITPKRAGGPRIMIGGGGPKRTLPLVARYADIWNCGFLAPDDFKQRSALLDDLLRAQSRQPGDVRRTMMTALFFGSDRADLERRLGDRRNDPQVAGKSIEEVIAYMHTERHAIVGTPDDVVEQIASYAAAGVEELMLQWFDLDDIDNLRAFAGAVLPRVQ